MKYGAKKLVALQTQQLLAHEAKKSKMYVDTVMADGLHKLQFEFINNSGHTDNVVNDKHF